MKTKRNARLILSVAAMTLSAGVMAGCSHTARPIDPNDPSQLRTVKGLDPAKVNAAATTMVDSILQHPVMRKTKPDGDPIYLVVNRVDARVSDRQFDTDSLTGKIRTELSKTGKVQTLSVGGSDQQVAGVREKMEEDAFFNNQSTLAKPDYILDGWITSYGVSSGKDNAMTYQFHMRLTDPKTGAAVWEEEHQVGSAGRRDLIGK